MPVLSSVTGGPPSGWAGRPVWAAAGGLLGVVELAVDGAHDEAGGFGAFATELHALVLLEGLFEGGEILVERRRPHEVPGAERRREAIDHRPCVVDGVALRGDQLADVGPRGISRRTGDHVKRRTVRRMKLRPCPPAPTASR